MKVLHLINTLSAGGAELHLLTLCRHLMKRRVETVVACLREQVKDSRSLRRDFEKNHIKVIDLRADSRYDSLFFGRIGRVLARERPDILHSHLPRADVAGAFARFLRPSMAWVSSVHAIYSEDWSARWSLPVIRLLWRRADAILCISRAVRDWMVWQGLPPGKTRVIYYGIEPENFSQPALDLRARWNLNGGPVIGTLGRLEPRKGHHHLIAAMPEVCKKAADARLLIAGHDPWGYGKNLTQLIADLGLNDKVRLVGFQNDAAAFLNALDVFAFASHSEGFGQVVIEAMAAGKPVVASKVPPLTEIVEDGGTGLLVESGNPAALAAAISELLNRPDERRSMGSRGRERVAHHFAAGEMADQTVALYGELLRNDSVLRAMA